MPTIGIDFKMKTSVINGRRVKIQVVSVWLTVTIVPTIINFSFNYFSNAILVGYSWTGEISQHNYILLQTLARNYHGV